MPASSLAHPPTTLAGATRCRACPLRAMPLFLDNSAQEVDFVQSLKVGEQMLRARASILREGDTAERLFTLLSGWAFRYKTLPDGRRQILNFLLPGDLIGLQGKLFEIAVHGVEALTDVSLCLFSRDRIWEVFQKFPPIGFDITWLAAHEEALVDESLLSVGQRSAAERMASLLLNLNRRASALGLAQADGVRLPLTQTHLADALGLSAVHANRTLQNLRRRGLIEWSAGVLRKLDIEGLQKLAGATDVPPEKRPLI